MNDSLYILLILVLPLAGFLLLGLFGKNVFKNSSGVLGTALMVVTTAIACYIAWQYFFVVGKVGDVYQPVLTWQYTWLEFSGYAGNINGSTFPSVNVGILLDPISVMMLIVITLISLMVHIYSLGYMKGEERFSTYYAFLSLFTFSMLGLVISPNIVQTYIFWELVGVSSFLLIGFYFTKPSAVAASKKAFIVTRFADLGFLIGILILAYYAGSLDFSTIIERLTDPGSNAIKASVTTSFLGATALSWATALVFMGGAGKSAMFPLHIWLPDAMEGPTPVSALIHAATMVVAGVYLVARLFPVFAVTTPAVLEMIAWVGAFSAIFAAVIACTQTDIKRVLAYSTMSQIAFMMFALGVAKFDDVNTLGYTASMFHLFTHAMFKALLFLGAGAVIHMVHSNEMRDMGGLRKLMPITHITFLIGCLAIAGLPPFAGFFSKEEILLAAYNSNPAIYWVALITSLLTAFYMFRLYFTIFWNKPATVHNHQQKEGTASMLLPLIILAIGAAAAGFIPFGKFVSATGKPLEGHLNIQFSILPVALGLAGILLAYFLYRKQNSRADNLANSLGALYKGAFNKFYIDEVYQYVTRNIIFNIGKTAAWFDKNVVDGFINFTGDSTVLFAKDVKGFQSGRVQEYGIWFLTGVIVLAVVFIYLW